MSAIFGVVHFDNRPLDPVDLESVRTALAHHGIDGGLWCEGSTGMGTVLLPFTPQDAYERQPLLSRDGAFTLVSDARLDNRRELRPSVDLHTPDSELLLEAYARWGTECVHHLTGVFAFAVWDARTQSLFAARSPIVAPTFVYTADAHRFAFATMPSGLHALPQFPRALDEVGLVRWLSGLGGTPATTLYKDILSLPSGHWLLANRDGVKTVCYWQPDLSREIHFARDEEYLAAFNELFTRVVDDYLHSTTPVAIQMSGGLDSSSLAAAAATLLAARGEQLAAFTEVPRSGFASTLSASSYGDETPFVEAIAAMYPNLILSLVRTDGQFFLDNVAALFPYLEGPFQNNSNRVWIEKILDTSRQQGMHVLLDGMQGNLTLSSNGGGWLFSLLHHGRYGEAAHQLRGFARTRGLGPAVRLAASQGLLPQLPQALWQLQRRLRLSGKDAGASFLAHSPINPALAAEYHLADLARDSTAAKRLQSVADLRLPRYEMLVSHDSGVYLTAYRAMYGVDMRSPTADVRLAEFCLALPEEQYFRDGVPRSFIRRAMAGRLPPAVLDNRKRGVQASDWFDRLLGARPLVAATLADLETSDLAQHVLDLRRMRRLFDDLPSYRADNLSDYLTLQFVLQDRKSVV